MKWRSVVSKRSSLVGPNKSVQEPHNLESDVNCTMYCSPYPCHCQTQQAILTQSLLQQADTLCYQRFTNSTVSTIKQNVLFANAADVPGTKRTLITMFHLWLQLCCCLWNTFLCNQCTLHALPFADDSDRPSIITQGDDTADKSMSERPLDFECLHSKGLNFIHLNTGSILPKLDDLRMFAAKTKAAVIGITEFWLVASVTDSEIDIAEYTIIRRDRNREGGGVCI